jgi:NADH-quinone oxidoreductase subunit G
MMVKIQIDGRPYEADSNKNLLETCLALGINVPHFCYHAALGSVGACRLCAVKKFRNAADTSGKIVMSCMEPVKEGLIVSVDDPEARAFRAAVIESLMINHPHDCPVCDEGGECHLQDMTVMTGHTYRRYNFRKRTFRNQDLGPFINHEMNRCIQCYRCVRFYNDYAGGTDLSVFGAHDHVYFGRHEEGTLENEFSGNLAEVCPTGVFTDKTLKQHYTRKWDLSNTPSICIHCGVGCNTLAGERYGLLRRIMSRYHGAVNGYFLCDRGRFGYEFVNAGTRIKVPRLRVTKDAALEEISEDLLKSILTTAFSGAARIAGIGSPRSTLEANYALSKLVGKENFYHGISRHDHLMVQKALEILRASPAHSPSLREIGDADAVLILGEDLTNTAPMAALAVRQAVRNQSVDIAAGVGIPPWHAYAIRDKAGGAKSPVFIATSSPTKLDDIAVETYRGSPVEIKLLGHAVASAINNEAPGVVGLDNLQRELAVKIANALLAAKNPVVITGMHSGSAGMLEAASNIASALVLSGKKANLSIQFPECNTAGLGMMEGKPLDDAVSLAEKGLVDLLIVLENDLYRRIEKEKADLLLGKCRTVIVLDHTGNPTVRHADILIPVGTFAGSEGTMVSSEGRAQRFYRVLPETGSVLSSWHRLRELMMIRAGEEAEKPVDFDTLVIEMIRDHPGFSLLEDAFPDENYRFLNDKIKRQTLRFSGRTAITANLNVSEPKPPEDPASALAFSMEGSDETPPSSLVPYYWLPGWNSYQAQNFYLDAPGVSLKGGDPGVCLFNGRPGRPLAFFKPVVYSPTRKRDEMTIFPVHTIFGSEELSSASAPVAGRIPDPFILLNSNDAGEKDLKEGDTCRIAIGNVSFEVKVRIEKSIPDSTAGLSAGLPGMPWCEMPGKGTLTKSNPKQP